MQLPGLSVGIVADDMTGACDTALQFFSFHASTHVLLDLHLTGPVCPEEGQENQVWSINTSSRHLPPIEAQAMARQAAALCRDRFGVVNIYKKIDSTLRGHIAQECLGLLDELKAHCAVIVPAYPQEGRRTVGGYQLVRGVPVERTPIARDPRFPVRISHLPTLLEQASRPDIVGHISLSVVLHGAGPILVTLNELIKEGKKLVVIDATTTEDLEQIALAIEKAQKYHRVIPCGSAGLAQALADVWGSEPGDAPRISRSRDLSAPPSPILVVSGSTTETTRQQVLKLIENYPYYGQGSRLEIFDLAPDLILGLAPADHLVEELVTALDERNTVVLSTALKEETIHRTLQLAREHDIPEEEASLRAQTLLGRLTKAVLDRKDAKLVLIGGETTCEVCRHLGSRQLELLAEADVSIPLTRDEHKRWVVTKSGGFGSPMALANVIQFIKQHETSSINV